LFDEARDALTSHQIASLFQVSVPTVHAWRTRGVRGVVLPSFVLGARRLFRREDVSRFVNQLQQAGAGDVAGTANAQATACAALPRPRADEGVAETGQDGPRRQE
jgi:hypothetical protein